VRFPVRGVGSTAECIERGLSLEGGDLAYICLYTCNTHSWPQEGELRLPGAATHPLMRAGQPHHVCCVCACRPPTQPCRRSRPALRTGPRVFGCSFLSAF
jgi:hypothetical protein